MSVLQNIKVHFAKPWQNVPKEEEEEAGEMEAKEMESLLKLHRSLRSSVRQLVVVRCCLNEDGEASVGLKALPYWKPPVLDEHTFDAVMQFIARLLVMDNQIVANAVQIELTQSQDGKSSGQTGLESSDSSCPVSYRLTIFVSDGKPEIPPSDGSYQGLNDAPPKTSLLKRGMTNIFNRIRQSKVVKFYIASNSSHRKPSEELDFQLLGPVELSKGTSWLTCILSEDWWVLK